MSMTKIVEALGYEFLVEIEYLNVQEPDFNADNKDDYYGGIEVSFKGEPELVIGGEAYPISEVLEDFSLQEIEDAITLELYETHNKGGL